MLPKAPLPSLRLVPDRLLHLSKPAWWLESRFHFAFAEWAPTERERLRFGQLRVLNDDVVAPGAGFGTHPHRDAEIFTYVVEGALAHKDSMQNRETLAAGCVQYMSAGTGVWHEEMNGSDEVPVRFLQVWLTPDRRGHTPQYGSKRFGKEDRHNRLLQILAGTTPPPAWGVPAGTAAARLHADVNVYVSELDTDAAPLELALGSGRQAYVVCVDGALAVNDGQATLQRRDAAAIVGEDGGPTALKLAPAGDKGAHLMLIEMKKG